MTHVREWSVVQSALRASDQGLSRDVFNLHIYSDRKYGTVDAHVQDLMRAVKPGGRPHQRRVPGCVVITMSWKHWPCLFPQHGPGRKHERPIVLERWQADIRELCCWALDLVGVPWRQSNHKTCRSRRDRASPHSMPSSGSSVESAQGRAARR